MPYFKTSTGIKIFYRDWGTGKPVVFLSGWALSSRQWQHQMYQFCQHGYRCIAYDRRGHGLSDDSGGGYDYDSLSLDLFDLIKHLDLNNITLVAHSFGVGEIVRLLSAQGNFRISRIAFLAPMLPFPKQTEDNPDGIQQEILEKLRLALELDFPKWLNDNKIPYVGANLPGNLALEAISSWTIQDMLQTSLQAVIECNRSVCETDFREELTHIDVPTLIIQGDCDASIPIEISGYKIAQLVPVNELKVYKYGPHGLYLTHRELLKADLMNFIQ
jgi:non-heme chloroperoxidase